MEKGYSIDEKEKIKQHAYDFNSHSFSDFFKEKVSKLLDEKGIIVNKYSIAEEKKKIAKLLDIDYDLFRKYINNQKRMKKRDLIIAICALIQANSTETDNVLDFFKMPELEPSWDEIESRDGILIDILDTQGDDPYSITEINKKLADKHYNILDIIDHKKKDTLPIKYPYPLLKKKVECRIDELFYGDQYNSLSTEYDINRYYIIARMWLGSKEKYYELHTANNSGFFVNLHTNNNNSLHSYNSIEETGKFEKCFIELMEMVKSEKKKMVKILNDTKNYCSRKSASIINNEPHVYYETYNYSIPEKGEYYLMDYSNGKYTLYVSPESIFMHFYLPEKVYNEIYGKSIDIKTYLKRLERYNSIESMEKKLESDKKYRYPFLKRRIYAFKTIKLEIDSLIEKLKTGEKHILNREYVFSNPCDILKYYNVAEDFQCTYDEEYDEITNGIEKATFSIDDKQEIELSFENLIDGFELGLTSIDEIGKFLLKHKSLKIADCISNGTI